MRERERERERERGALTGCRRSMVVFDIEVGKCF